MQVWLSSWNVLTVHCVAFIIQSAAFSAEHLDSRVEVFIGSLTQQLQDMTPEEFGSQVKHGQGICLCCMRLSPSFGWCSSADVSRHRPEYASSTQQSPKGACGIICGPRS